MIFWKSTKKTFPGLECQFVLSLGGPYKDEHSKEDVESGDISATAQKLGPAVQDRLCRILVDIGIGGILQAVNSFFTWDPSLHAPI